MEWLCKYLLEEITEGGENEWDRSQHLTSIDNLGLSPIKGQVKKTRLERKKNWVF